jgi:hypothetical protein
MTACLAQLQTLAVSRIIELTTGQVGKPVELRLSDKASPPRKIV